MKKKLFSIIMCVLMVMCFMPSMAFADVVADGWDVLTESDSGALSTEGNKIVITPRANNGAYTKTMRNNPIQNGTTTYDVIVDLSEDYQHGELFTISLGFGTDANTYNTEFCVATQRSGDNFILSAGVDPGKSITLAPGVYTYRYTVIKTDSSVSSSFEVVETGDKLNFTYATELDKLKQSEYVRYLWAFGKSINDNYILDRNLVMYKTPVVAKVGSEAYTTLAAAVEAANTGSDKVITLVASASVEDLTIPADTTLKIINRAKLTISGNLTVNGTLDMSKATPTENSFALEIKAGAYYNVNGNVISGSQTFADVRQLGTLTITNTGKYQIKAAGMTEALTYIGAGGAVTLGENSKVVSVPNDNEDYADGYTYTLTGTATANDFTIMGNDSFVIPNNSEFKVNELTLNGAKKNQLIVENGGKLSKAVAEPTFSVASGKTWEVTSGTFYFDPSSYKTGNYVPDGYVSTENNDGSYTVSKKVVYGGGSSSSKTSTTTTELEKAKTEAKADVKTEAEASKYEDAEATEVKAIKEQADKDIAAAKTVEEVKQIEAEAEAKIEAIPTAEEKAEIATVKGVSKQVFKAKSKKAKLHGKKAIKVSWTLPAGISVDGFEVYRSTSKFSGFGTEPYFTTTKSTYTNNKDLEKGNTYYYKVKGYKMINGEKVYTGWSTKAYRTI